MTIIRKARILHFTHHAREKMRHYRLSESRIKRILHSPKRVEEGIAPETIAMMQPTSLKRTGKKETWSQEIWVMIEDMPKRRNVVSAWRYPGTTKPRDELTQEFLRQEYAAYVGKEGSQ